MMRAQKYPIPILFSHYGDQWVRGSERVLLDLLGSLDPSRIKPVVWCNGWELASRVASLEIPVYRADFPHYFDFGSPRFSLSRYVAIVRQGLELVERHDISVLHANGAAPAQWLVPVARSNRLPLLSHLHAPYLRRSRFVNLLHQADLIVGVSAEVTRAILGDGMPAERAQVIYNGVDMARLTAVAGSDLRQSLGIPNEAVVLAAVGSLVQHKGYDILLRALGQIDPLIDLHLLIAGDGPERGALEQLANELGLRPRVHFLGFVEDTPSVYRSSDVLALASRREGFGLVAAEAGFFGLPVVATKVGGIPEVVADGVSGMLVPPDDPAAMAAALARLVQDGEHRRALGEAGRQRAQHMFSTRRMTDEFEAAYERLAKIDRTALGWRGVARSIGPYGQLARTVLAPARTTQGPTTRDHPVMS